MTTDSSPASPHHCRSCGLLLASFSPCCGERFTRARAELSARAALASGDAAPTAGYLVASIRAKAADEAIGMCCEGTGECGIDDCRSDLARLSGLVDAADYVAALAARSPRPETAPDDGREQAIRELYELAVEHPHAGDQADALLARAMAPAAARSPREESAPTGEWWCANCELVVPAEEVDVAEERHTPCGQFAEWLPAPAETTEETS